MWFVVTFWDHGELYIHVYSLAVTVTLNPGRRLRKMGCPVFSNTFHKCVACYVNYHDICIGRVLKIKQHNRWKHALKGNKITVGMLIIRD